MNSECSKVFDFHAWRSWFAADLSGRDIAEKIKAEVDRNHPDLCRSCSLAVPPPRAGGHRRTVPTVRACTAIKKPNLKARSSCDLYRKISLVRLWREALGISRADLVSRMGITISTLYYTELGYRKNMRADTIQRYAEALGINKEQLL